MKYFVVIGDGMSDLPLKALGGKTPLEAAKTPNLDYIAQYGVCGWTKNVPTGMIPGSDVAAMSIFGYDPKKGYTGRGPLEAASLGVKLGEKDIAFRCNLVTVKNGTMADFTAGHISTEDAKRVFRELNKKIGSKNIEFIPGLSYRNLLVFRNLSGGEMQRLVGTKTTPPHDISGKKIGSYLPKGRGEETLLSIINESELILRKIRSKATIIWPWGQGGQPRIESFSGKYKKSGAVITAVHLLKGLGLITGMEVINVPGATGYLDTNYSGKAKYAINAIKRHEVVFVHVEAPDEAGHEGDVRHKIRAIEDFDRLVVGPILEKIRLKKINAKILVLPDHPTPIKYMTHTADPVPFAIFSSYNKLCSARIKGYSERQIRKSKFKIKHGHELLTYLFK
ncbi:MAG: cofactor-independent phosphoglycerate mutase [Candidatus Margulisbacteria bacterium]|nr:cofactor-independent phosphoglycerate mutase [Candidatus Margulisiibacteriota bacterium]